MEVHADFVADLELALDSLAGIAQKKGRLPTGNLPSSLGDGFSPTFCQAQEQSLNGQCGLRIFTFRVDAPSFLAGAVATLAFFVAFSELIKLFFSIVINQVLL